MTRAPTRAAHSGSSKSNHNHSKSVGPLFWTRKMKVATARVRPSAAPTLNARSGFDRTSRRSFASARPVGWVVNVVVRGALRPSRRGLGLDRASIVRHLATSRVRG